LVLLHSHGDCEGAVRAFAQCIQLDPTYERACLDRGLAYEGLGNLQQAIEDYTKAIDLASDDAKLFYVRGLALRRLGMDAEAIKDFTRAADLGHWPAHDELKSIGCSL
jgi:Flp pilus assembly protein TadD